MYLNEVLIRADPMAVSLGSKVNTKSFYLSSVLASVVGLYTLELPSGNIKHKQNQEMSGP